MLQLFEWDEELSVDGDVKRCRDCGRVKPLSAFPVHHYWAGRIRPACSKCHGKATQLLAWVRSSGMFARMFLEQGGRCRICKRPPPLGESLCVDHEHGTDRVRGLLCHQCNTALGKFDDDIGRLREAIRYLCQTKTLSTPRSEPSGTKGDSAQLILPLWLWPVRPQQP